MTAAPSAAADPIATAPATSEPLELRILSGMHRNARCAARHEALVGADPDCDIVLTDAGLPARAARLMLGRDGWDLIPDPRDQQDPTDAGSPATPYNQPLPLGPVWITVAHPSDPWQAPPVPDEVEGEAGEPAAPPADAAPVSSEPADTPGPADSSSPRTALAATNTSAAAAPRPAAPMPHPRSPAWGIRIGLAALVLAIATALLMVALSPRAASNPAPRADARLAAEQSISQITAALDRLGLASRLHVAMTPNGMAQVSGWVRNEEERNRLAAALVQIWPMPAMRISNEAEVLSTARNALKGFGVTYEARYEGDGRLAVAGVADDGEIRAMAVEAVRAQLPGMTIMGNEVLLAPDVMQALGRDLTAAGLGAMTLVWRRHQLQVDSSPMDAGQMATAQNVLDRFNRTHFGVATLAQPDKPYADTVPFRIRSVVGGETPFIVLDNGTKLLVGGTHQHYRLTKIDDRRLVFEGPRPAIVLR